MLTNGRTGWKKALPFLLPSLIGLFLFSFLPILISLLISLTSWTGMSRVSLTSGFFTFIKDNFIGLENFKNILSDKEVYKVISHNFYFIILYLPLMIILSLSEALIINSSYKGSNTYRIIFYIPVLTSWVAGALIWKWLFSPTYGPINNLLLSFGIEGSLWLQSETMAMPSIAIASIWKDLGFYAMIFLGGLRSINPSYYEAANIDGATTWQRFRKITLPMLSPITFYIVMLSLINAFQLFPQVMVMTKNGDAGPNGATMVMVERIYKYAFRYGKMGYAAAFSWVLFTIIFFFTYLQRKIEKKWVNYDV
ncbi:MAG: sugar ABC transporter permease [Sphaerochaetaceae bacterium]|nr:sugar ABC transporter permease [Sphaerochaetaceae bacterium]